ncbi:hypothetical protein B0H11DRAFT_1901448 [Mycena galericulata]|nr:hypothetical protein B0H11DRAFT_1901448 [Mycena galericulata]
MQYKRYMNLGQSTPISVSPWLRSLIWAAPDDGHQELTLAEMNTLATSEDCIIEEPSSTPQLSITGFVYSAELLNDMSGARIYRLVAPAGRLELFKTQMETFYRVNRIKLTDSIRTPKGIDCIFKGDEITFVLQRTHILMDNWILFFFDSLRREGKLMHSGTTCVFPTIVTLITADTQKMSGPGQKGSRLLHTPKYEFGSGQVVNVPKPQDKSSAPVPI